MTNDLLCISEELNEVLTYVALTRDLYLKGEDIDAHLDTLTERVSEIIAGINVEKDQHAQTEDHMMPFEDSDRDGLDPADWPDLR